MSIRSVAGFVSCPSTRPRLCVPTDEHSGFGSATGRHGRPRLTVETHLEVQFAGPVDTLDWASVLRRLGGVSSGCPG